MEFTSATLHHKRASDISTPTQRAPKREVLMIPYNEFRYRLLVTIWPLCFAAFLAMQGLYGTDLEGKEGVETLFHVTSAIATVLLVTTALFPKRLWLRMTAGLVFIGVNVFRVMWLLDPNFIPTQKWFGASLYALVIVSALGWVMAADFEVVSSRIRDTSGK